MEITLLDKNDCIGNQRKEPFKHGYTSYITDFATLMGTYYEDYWLKTPSQVKGENASCIGFRPVPHTVPYVTCVGVRPVLLLENEININNAYIDNQKLSFFPVDDTIEKAYFGSFPRNVASSFLQKKLEVEYLKKDLKKTGKTFDLKTEIFEEYEYEGKKYIRGVVKKLINRDSSITLSDENEYDIGSQVWIEVEPISWLLLDEHRLVSEDILFAMELDKKKDYDGDFETTTLYNYLNTSFKKEITDGFLAQEVTNNINETIPKKVKKINPYNFNFDKVSEEEIIKGALLSDIPVFLHGASGDGKSQRVKQFDEDATIIYLRNSSMESFNGKSVYNSNTGEMIDVMPSWLKKVYEKCEIEPNKLHIVFFDEINNASNVIQGMAFNVVLNKEVNGIWKLPENARIVAAGNETKDSLSAEELSEPLFNRFAHVYINTTTEDWLKWASTPNESYERLDNTKVISEYKIHPSIYAYISYKSYMKKPVLRTKYNGVTPNADPRKWEMASKVLYATGKPDMLRSLVGKELANDFMEFTKKEVITVEDVINHNYDINSINEMNISEKYNLAVGLSVVDKENLEIVRDFVYNVGKEIGATFDTLWAHGNEDRLEYLLEIGSKKQTKKSSSVKENTEKLDFTLLDYSNLSEVEFNYLIAEVTDFSVCLGAKQIGTNMNKNENGNYWIFDNNKKEVKLIDRDGVCEGVNLTEIHSVRPLLTNASNLPYTIKEIDGTSKLSTVEFGEYPQMVPSSLTQDRLKTKYEKNELELTGNYYTVYKLTEIDKNSNCFLETIELEEYKYNNKRYIRMEANFASSYSYLSDDYHHYTGEPVWIEVEPIKWYLYKNNEGQDCLLSKDLLFSGVPFSAKEIYDGDFKKTFIKKFMDECFSKDILRGKTLEENNSLKLVKKF